MRHLARLSLIAAFVCLAFAIPNSAQAQYPGAGFGCYGGYGYYGPYRGANAKVLPYFSLHPPVYYSHPVPRPYGYSPFALPPGVSPVEAMAEPIQPQAIKNPYFKRQQAEDQPAEQTASAPRRIANPFYVKSEPKTPATTQVVQSEPNYWAID